MQPMNDTPAVTQTPKQCSMCPHEGSDVRLVLGFDCEHVPVCAVCHEYVKREQLQAAYALYGAELDGLAG